LRRSAKTRGLVAPAEVQLQEAPAGQDKRAAEFVFGERVNLFGRT
jgi:hypothetical protein